MENKKIVNEDDNDDGKEKYAQFENLSSLCHYHKKRFV